jgi:hypothetical protein
MRRTALLVLVTLATACRPSAPTPMKPLVILTREGCANSPLMRERVDGALRALNLPKDYQVINIATLAATDPRSGYPTPTVLYGDRDLFGMPEPTPPYPEPT